MLTVKLHVCSSDAQTNLFQASKGTLCSQTPCLTSVERDDPIYVFPVLQYPLQEWKTYIFTNPSPRGGTYSCGVDTKTQKASLQKKKGGFAFFPFILFTAFYLPLVHTMEAIVAFAAAKTGHKVLSNLCHMACLCFALPTASPLKILQPQWRQNALDVQQQHFCLDRLMC